MQFKQKAQSNTQEGAVGQCIAEIGHTLPDNKAPERACHQSKSDSREECAYEEIVNHGCTRCDDCEQSIHRQSVDGRGGVDIAQYPHVHGDQTMPEIHPSEIL